MARAQQILDAQQSGTPLQPAAGVVDKQQAAAMLGWLGRLHALRLGVPEGAEGRLGEGQYNRAGAVQLLMDVAGGLG